MGSDSLLTESSATGSATGTSGVGGLVGWNAGTTTGSATGSVSGSDRVGGLVGFNSGTVLGYVTGSVGGNDRVGGLVGFNSGGVVSGYVTGSTTGNDRVGGLVGFNSGTVSGYATGLVAGNENVGGLVGFNAGAVLGYTRSVVRRRSGMSLAFGRTIGTSSGTSITYISVDGSKSESKIYNGETGITRLSGTTGIDGTAVAINGSSTSATKEWFDELSFGTSLGEWTWVVNGKWPAINIGDEIRPANEQPLDP